MTLLNPELYIFTWASIPLFFTGALLATLCIFLLVREKSSPPSRMFVLLVFSTMIWLLAQCGAYASGRPETALLWIKIENAGLVFIPTFFYLFTLSVLQRIHLHRISAWFSLGASYIFLLIVVLTDWIVADVYQYPWGFYGRYSLGALAFMWFFASLLIHTLELYWQEHKKSHSTARKGKFRILWEANIFALLAGVDFLPAFGIGVYPFGFVFVLLFIIWTARLSWEYTLSDITPSIASQEIIHSMSEGLIVADREGAVRMINSAACRFLATTAKKITGARVWDHADPLVTEKKFHAILEGRAAQGYEVTMTDRSGKDVFFSVMTSAVRHVSDAPEAIVFMIRDVTDERLAKRVLEQANDELERRVSERTAQLESANERLREMDEQKTRFLALVSHELRTPLTSIHGFLSLMLSEKAGTLSEAQKRSLSAMKKSTDRLYRLVVDLLHISKIELGQFQMNMALNDLSEIIDEELLIMEGQIRKKEQKIVKKVADLAEPVFCDRDKIKEVIENLLSNAIKYTPRKGTISLTVEAVEGGVEMLVSDTGIGFKECDIPRLFEPFQHLCKSGLEGEESTGLGLSLVKKIVEAHGGKIMVSSKEGVGSQFKVRLPYRAADLKAA